MLLLYKKTCILYPRKRKDILPRRLYIISHHTLLNSLVRDLWPTLYINYIYLPNLFDHSKITF